MELCRVILFLAGCAIITLHDVVGQVYTYQTSVTVDEDCSSASESRLIGHQLTATVHLTSVWHNGEDKLIKIEVSEPKLLVTKKTTYQPHSSKLDNFKHFATFVHLSHGKVQKILENPKEQTVLRNLKRGIASLLQSGDTDKISKQSDVAGNCDVIYKSSGKVIRLGKGNCLHPGFSITPRQEDNFRSATVLHSASAECETENEKDVFFQKCSTVDHVKVFSNVWEKPTICITARSNLVYKDKGIEKQNLGFTDIAAALKSFKDDTIEESNLFSIPQNRKHRSPKTLIASVSSYQDNLKISHLAKLKSAAVFLKLLPDFRAASKDDIIQVLNNKKLKAIMPQLLDVIAAANSENSLSAVFETFDFNKGNRDLIERYLISLSVVPTVRSEAFTKIQAVLERKNIDDKVRATLLTTLGALIKTYSTSDVGDEKVVESSLSFLEAELKKCTSDPCRGIFLRGLCNAEHPKSVPLFLQISSQSGKPCLEALSAIRRISQKHELPPMSRNILLKVYNQVGAKYDRSSRAIAAEILLTRFSDEEVLRVILASLKDQSDPEFTTFVASKIIYFIENDQRLSIEILKVLTHKEVSHYYSLSQKGSSSLFQRQLLATTGLNVTYGIEMEMLEGGLLKRSSLDVNVRSLNEVSNLLSVGMFGEGLSSFAGDSSGGEEEESIAGMELRILGASLRPYIFFNGVSELMSHAWSGTASELTPALQGNFLLSDVSQNVVLSNGMTVQLEVSGVLSTDLSASIQISLWNRASQSQVKNAASLLLRGSAVVDTGFVTTEGGFTFTGQSSINFNTDLNFYEAPFQMCLQMEQPEFLFRHDIQRKVLISGSKFLQRTKTKRRRTIDGRSFALHSRNDQQCKLMKS